MSPDQVLDMNIPMLRACVEGYAEHLFQQKLLTVLQGYWSGYYQSKKPKNPQDIINKMIKEHESTASSSSKIPTVTTETDVETFLAREQRLQQFYAER